MPSRNPLVPVALAFAAGIWAAPHIFLSASQQVFWLSVIFFAAVVLLWINRYSYGLVVALMGFFLCGTFLAAEEKSALPPQHIETLVQHGVIVPESALRITGWARIPSVRRPGGDYFDFELTSVEQSGAITPAVGAVRLYYFAPRDGPAYLDIPYGTRLSISLRNLRPPRNFMTAGFYDSEGNLIRQGIYFNGIVRRAADAERLPGREGRRWRTALYGLRGRFLVAIDGLFPQKGGSRTTGAIVKAMLLSDNNWLDPETTAAFQESGTYHLLVVAGLHVGALVFGLFWLFSWMRLPRWLETLAIFVCLAIFTFLASARIPAMRASLMISCYLVARLVYRERALLNSIAAAALILLILHPSDLYDSGFQLSFLAVLTIGAIVAPLVDWTITPYRLALIGLDEPERDMRLEPLQAQFRCDVRVLLQALSQFSSASSQPESTPSRLWSAFLLKAASGLMILAESAVAVIFIQAGLSLSMAIYFHRVVWSGMFANLLVLPLIGIVIPLGFAVLLLSLIWFPLASTAVPLLGLVVAALRSVVGWSANLPHLDRRVSTPPLLVGAIFAAVLFLIALFAARRSRLVWLPIAALVPLGLILTFAPYRPQLPQGRLELTVLDVGQGDSLFLAFPRGHTMLIDGGGSISIPGQAPSRLDVGERIIGPYLWSRQLKAIDVAVLTHAHADHIGGLMNVLRDFRVGELWIGPGPSDVALDRLLHLASRRGVRVVRRQSGDKIEIDGVAVEVFSPAAEWSPKRIGNNDSLVMRLGYGRRHILLPGDAEARMERRIVENDFPIASEILKVGHHGSRTSTMAPFLGRVAPRFGIISVGAFSRFGHPNQEVLDALQQAGVVTYRTDADGSVTVSTDGNRIELAIFRDTLSEWPAFHVEPFPFARQRLIAPTSAPAITRARK